MSEVLIMVKRDSDEDFYSQGYDEERSRVLHSSLKQGTAFKKHVPQFIQEKQTQDESKIFFFLLSITDRKKKFNKFFGNVNTHPIDVPYETFSSYSSKGNEVLPHNLDGRIPNLRDEGKEIVLKPMKNIAEVSNSNLVQNVKKRH